MHCTTLHRSVHDRSCSSSAHLFSRHYVPVENEGGRRRRRRRRRRYFGRTRGGKKRKMEMLFQWLFSVNYRAPPTLLLFRRLGSRIRIASSFFFSLSFWPCCCLTSRVLSLRFQTSGDGNSTTTSLGGIPREGSYPLVAEEKTKQNDS